MYIGLITKNKIVIIYCYKCKIFFFEEADADYTGTHYTLSLSPPPPKKTPKINKQNGDPLAKFITWASFKVDSFNEILNSLGGKGSVLFK